MFRRTFIFFVSTTVAALVLACACVARAASAAGVLKVKAEGVEIHVPDAGIVFKVGRTAQLFELREDRLIVSVQQPGGDMVCAVRWNSQEAPAWISNERLVTFGKIATTVPGTIRLEAGEELPVVAAGQQDYRVQITRFGRTALLDVPRNTAGVVFEAGAPTQPAPAPTPAPPVVQPAAPKPPPPVKPRIIIEGSGDLVVIRTNDTTTTAVEPVAPAPSPVVTQETPAVVQPVEPVEIGVVETATEPTAKKPLLANLPPVLRDTQSLIIIFIFVALIVIFLLIQRKMIQRKAAAAKPAEAPTPAPAAAPSGALKLKRERAAAKPAPAAPPPPPSATGQVQPLKFASSKKNQTVILGQQNLLGNTPQPRQTLQPVSASDTALIPSPSVLPERRPSGVLYIGKYQVEQLLGRGRMGVVYKAFQQDLNRSVALKLLAEGGHASSKTRERFIKEAQAIARLRHPNIITVYEVGEWEGQPYFTMDFVDGKSLDKMIVKQKLAPPEAARLARQIALAIEYAHANGIIHRDLKPGNIILNTKGEPVITDFGLARDLEAQSAQAGDDILGTPAYMSPEQARGRSGETDARSDVYAIGAILFAMLTGDDPFGGTSLIDTLHKVIHDKPPAPHQTDPTIDPAISAICMKAMQKDPKKRHQTAAEFAADLEKYLAVINSGRTPASASAHGTKPGLLARLFGRA